MQSRTLSKSDIQDINEGLKKEFGKDLLDTDDNVRLIEEDHDVITLNGTPAFFKQENSYIPTIKILLENDMFMPTITVDMGAVKHVVDGADTMIPGVVGFDTFYEDDIICVIDVDNQKPLAVGKALMDSEDLAEQQKGRVVENIHYVGDDIWNLY